jgi:hypothetical protein
VIFVPSDQAGNVIASLEMIERFRRQLFLVDLQFEGDPDRIGEAVWPCFQESPVNFRGYSLYDMGPIQNPFSAGN